MTAIVDGVVVCGRPEEIDEYIRLKHIKEEKQEQTNVRSDN